MKLTELIGRRIKSVVATDNGDVRLTLTGHGGKSVVIVAPGDEASRRTLRLATVERKTVSEEKWSGLE
jgi:hypothetical protein